jgi:deoxycytidine triphosphate deaminase
MTDVISYKPINEDPRPDVDKRWEGAVLLADEIKYYAELPVHPLVDPFDKENLKAASYDLTLGSECRVGGEPIILNEKNRYLKIPPYQVAVVSTYEKLCIPRFLIGRWNLRVKYAYEGLLWVGGPQVDPGYVGHLYAPIYNMSNREVILEYREPFATIDFVRTTKFTKDAELFKFKPKREDTLAAHDIHHLASGPFEAWRRVEEINRRMDTFQATVLPLIALVFTALAIIASMPELIRNGIENFVQVPLIMIIIAAVAVFISGWIAGRNARR